jgi:SAM-dependent methyltransferase
VPLPEFQSQSIPLNSVQHSAIVDFLELLFSGAIQVVPVTMCFCGNIEFEGLSRCDRFGLPFGTQICTECGLISQTVQLTQDSMPLFYEKIYWPLVTGTTPEAAQKDRYITPPKTDEVSSYILDCIANPRGKYKVFEVGCGSGLRIKRLSDELSGLGCDVEIFGSDYSPDALSQAKENDVTVVQGGFDELGVFGKADILILSHVFEHFPDLSLALSQINAVINDDSLVYIEVPGVNDLENKKEYSFNYQYYSVVAHTYNFSLQSLCNVMSAGGFRLIDGDEYVRSVFVRDKSGANFASAYEKSIDALQRASSKWKQLELRRNKPVVRYFRNLAKAILARGVQ